MKSAWQQLGFSVLAGVFFLAQLHPEVWAQNKNGDAVGSVLSVQGSLKILRADGITRDTCKQGTSVYLGDRVETDASGTGKIKFKDDSTLSVGKSTTIKITNYLFDSKDQKRTSILSLISGYARLVVTSYPGWSSNKYEVRTGAAVAGIRGTDIIAQVLADGTSEFYVLEGLIEVFAAEGTKQVVPIGAQQFSRVPLGGQPTIPTRFEAAKVKPMVDALGETLPAKMKTSQAPGNVEPDPGLQKTVSQGQWAKMLGDTLGLSAAGVQQGLDEQGYVNILSGSGSKIIEAEAPDNQSKYLAKQEGNAQDVSGGSYLTATGLSGTLRLSAFVPRRGKYPLRVKALGTLLVSIGENQTVVVETPADEKKMSWQNLGQFQLKDGENSISVVLSRGGAIDAFQIDSRCADPIVPAGGWNTNGDLTYAEKAETLVQVMNQQGNLPVDGSYIQIFKAVNHKGAKGDYKKVDYNVKETGEKGQENSVKHTGIQAGTRSVTLGWNLNLPSDGVYSFASQAAGTAPFVWVVDGCDIGSQVPGSVEPRGVWEDVATKTLPKGNHLLEVNVPAAGTVDSVRIIRRSGSPQDYLNLLASLGFKEGDLNQPVTKQAAIDNLNNEFLKDYLAGEKSTTDDEIAAAPPDTIEIPPDFTEEDEFPFSSPVSPVLPGFF